MKKVVALTLAILMLFSMFAACGKSETTENGKNENTSNGKNENASGTEKNELPSAGSGELPSAGGDASADEKPQVTYHPSEDAVLNIGSGYTHAGLCTLYCGGSPLKIQAHQFFFDTLIYYNSETNSLEPNLAETWEWIDNVTLRIKIREDVYSQIGDHLTANDVHYSFKTGCENAKLISTYGSLIDIANCKVVDEYTYDLALKTPNQFFIYELSLPQYTFVVEKSVETLGGLEKCNDNPACGTGSYKLVEWDQLSDVLKLERNEDYWGVKPYFKYINYYLISDPNTRAMGTEAGDYDVCLDPATSTAMMAMESDTLRTIVSPNSTTLMWGFNTNREPYNIKEVHMQTAQFKKIFGNLKPYAGRLKPYAQMAA